MIREYDNTVHQYEKINSEFNPNTKVRLRVMVCNNVKIFKYSSGTVTW